jgi:hypothetical protein
MVFELNNILTSGSFLGAYDPNSRTLPGIGFQYNLAPDRAIRAVVSIGRASDKYEIAESENLATGTVTKSAVFPTLACDVFFADGTANACTGVYNVNAQASYLMRMGTAALAPYFGAGAGLGIQYQRSNFKDNAIPAATVEYDGSATNLVLNVGAQAGLEWRIHKVISVFAEYGVNLALVDYTKFRAKVSTTSPTAGQEDKFSKTVLFNFDTGLNQGAQLGLLAHF